MTQMSSSHVLSVFHVVTCGFEMSFSKASHSEGRARLYLSASLILYLSLALLFPISLFWNLTSQTVGFSLTVLRLYPVWVLLHQESLTVKTFFHLAKHKLFL